MGLKLIISQKALAVEKTHYDNFIPAALIKCGKIRKRNSA